MTSPDVGLSVEVGPPLAADHVLGGDGTFGGILLDLAERYGARTALVTTAGRWTYTELADCAMAVARGLLATGVTTWGTRSASCLPNGLEWVAATFGIALLGAVPAPALGAVGAARTGGGVRVGRSEGRADHGGGGWTATGRPVGSTPIPI